MAGYSRKHAEAANEVMMHLWSSASASGVHKGDSNSGLV